MNSNHTEKNTVVGIQKHSSVVETNVEQSSSIINHENTADLEENAGKDKVGFIHFKNLSITSIACLIVFSSSKPR